MFTIFRTALLAAVVACPSHADDATLSTGGAATPQERIVGTGHAPDGYSNVKGSYWWNAADRHCLSVSVMNGSIQAITETRAMVCGLATLQSAKADAGAGCPVGTMPADYASFPDCRNIMAGR